MPFYVVVAQNIIVVRRLSRMVSGSTTSVPRREVILSRSQVESMIAGGKTIIIIDNKVLMVDAWLKYHPGGDKTIMHMVGRDATDEVNA